MRLDSLFADVNLIYDEDGNSFETWWIENESEVRALSHCPDNHPSTVIHTMTIADSIEQLSELVRTGWTLANYSANYEKHCGKEVLSNLKDD